jgi:hypothetical protein
MFNNAFPKSKLSDQKVEKKNKHHATANSQCAMLVHKQSWGREKRTLLNFATLDRSISSAPPMPCPILSNTSLCLRASSRMPAETYMRSWSQ